MPAGRRCYTAHYDTLLCRSLHEVKMPDPLAIALTRTYSTPRYEYGDTATDAIRGDVVIVKTSDAPIPWPMAKLPGGRKPGLVVFDGLLIALRTESNVAICHWWGVTGQTVTKWRRLLGIDQKTPGALRLRQQRLTPVLNEARHLIDYNAPERVQKIAAARTGKPRPKHVQAMLKTSRIGKPISAEHRQKLTEGFRRAGVRPPKAGKPWTPDEDHAVRTLSAAEVVKTTGRTLQAVYDRRRLLGVSRQR